MFRMRSMNPVFRSQNRVYTNTEANSVSYAGVISKSALLLGIMIVIGGYTMFNLLEQQVIPPIGLIIAAPIVGFISLLIAMFNPRLAPFFAIIYAAAQGVTLGLISGIYEIVFGDGIVLTAIIATSSVFGVMLFLYSTGIFRVTPFLRRVLFTALIGIVIASLFLFVLSIFGGLSADGMLGIIFAITIISVVVASLYLMVDFDNISKAVEMNVDKRQEWILTLGLLVTIVWLYIELLRLIAILTSRSRK